MQENISGFSEEDLEVIRDFVKRLRESQVDSDPKFDKFLFDNINDLFA